MVPLMSMIRDRHAAGATVARAAPGAARALEEVSYIVELIELGASRPS